MTRFLALLLMLLPLTAKADPVCADLWAMRNLAFARAGYCFSSALGQATFGNAGCVGTDVALSEPYDTRAFSEIREMESALNCRIDAAQLDHPLPDIAARARLAELPVRSDGESACLGWQRAPLALLDATHNGAATLGAVARGDNMLFLWMPRGAYEYVYVMRGDVRVNEGWVYLPVHDSDACAGWAG